MEKTKTTGKKKSNLRPIQIFYQPVFDVRLNMAIDYEISMRINDRYVGVIEQDTFIPIAKKSRQICDIEKWAIEECCDAIIRCEKRDVDINSIIMPMSIRHLTWKNFLLRVSKTIEKKDIYPDKFCFNINENIFENKKEQVVQNIKDAREFGFKFSIDDFGVEFTSLSHLGQYDVDYIGVHENLVDEILTSERAQNVVQGIIDFAKKIETKVRVDGVDCEEKATMLRKMGVDQMKGKFYGKPIAERRIKIN
ncbi:MAG TPA: EAL domain-containing protein [Clostridia bacterium]|nr:EAL domain-containing protein [Clostridia bacterium]